jgi:hypothetical protein
MRLAHFLSPASGERTKVRGRSISTERFMGSLHPLLARIGTLNLPHVRFVVERFSADFRMLRDGTTTALKRSTTNHSRSGCGSANPRFMERGNLWLRLHEDRERTI